MRGSMRGHAELERGKILRTSREMGGGEDNNYRTLLERGKATEHYERGLEEMVLATEHYLRGV